MRLRSRSDCSSSQKRAPVRLSSKLVRRPEVVVVEECDPLALRGCNPCVACGGDVPAGLEAYRSDAAVAERGEALRGLVRGAVVDDHHLELHASLAKHSAKRPLKQLPASLRGDDDAHLRGRAHQRAQYSAIEPLRLAARSEAANAHRAGGRSATANRHSTPTSPLQSPPPNSASRSPSNEKRGGITSAMGSSQAGNTDMGNTEPLNRPRANTPRATTTSPRLTTMTSAAERIPRLNRAPPLTASTATAPPQSASGKLRSRITAASTRYTAARTAAVKNGSPLIPAARPAEETG